jgi:hypothetical protein
MELINELLNLLEKDTPGLALGAFKLDTDNGKILTNIGGKTYEFTPNEKNVAELYNSIIGVAKHSPGKALAYLKQHAKGTPIAEALEISEEFKSDNKPEIAKLGLNFKKGDKVKLTPKTPEPGSKPIKGFGIVKKVTKEGFVDVEFPGYGSIYQGRRHPGDLTKVVEDLKVTEDLADQSSFNNLGKFEAAIVKHAVESKIKSWSTTIVSGNQVYHIRSKYFAVWDPETKRGIIDPNFNGKSFELIDQLKK